MPIGSILGGFMLDFINGVSGGLNTVLSIALDFLQAPLMTQLTLLLFSLVFFIIVCIVLFYLSLRFAGIFYAIYANWYLPAFEAILTKRMLAAKYSGEQIEAALAGRTVGRPVFRDKSKDLLKQEPTEDELLFEEMEKLDAELDALNDPDSELARLAQTQQEHFQMFEQQNPDFRKKLIAEIEKKEKRLARKL